MSQRPSNEAKLDGASEGVQRRAQSTPTSGGKKKHFSYLWFPDWWKPQVASRIEAWGEALHDLLECMTLRKPRAPRLKVDRAVDALLRLQLTASRQGWSRSRQAPRGRCGWEDAVRDMFHQAGMGDNELEDIALELVRRGWADLARTVVDLDEFLRPGQAGPARAHVLAVSGHRQEGIADLRRIVSDEWRDEWVRDHAVECLRYLRAR